MKNSRKRN